MQSPSPSLLLSFVTSVCLLSGSLAHAQVEGDRLVSPYPDATRGESALEELGDRLPAVAAKNDLSADELTALLRTDDAVWVDSEGRVLFIDIPAARESSDAIIPVSTIPTSEAFKLHSRPGADRIIYIDFTGHHSVNNNWGHNIVFPPFNLEGDSGTFTEAELQSIIAHWQYMAEDFAPFEVDVTTEEPPVDRLIKSGGGDQQWGIRDLHTQATNGFGDGIGGVAYVNSFTDNEDTPVFTFNKGDNNGSMSGSHEVGHSLGLYHDGVGGSSYHSGVGSGTTSWGPIMGAPFGKHLIQWSNGDYSNSTNTEDDYAEITKSQNGVDFKADDYGDAVGAATQIAPSCPDLGFISVDGLIETRNDKDAFEFQSPGGQVTVTLDPTVPGGNLDGLLELYDSSGTLIASDNPTNEAVASVTATTTAGTHTIVVDGVGKSGVYSDYGSVGVYTVAVNLPSNSNYGTPQIGSSGNPAVIATSGGSPTVGNPSFSIDVMGGNPNSFTVMFSGLSVGSNVVPWGTILVAGPQFLRTITSTDALGAASVTINITPALAGTTMYYQYAIRDPGFGGNVQASDGLAVSYCP